MKCDHCGYPYHPGLGKKCPNCGQEDTTGFRVLLLISLIIVLIFAFVAIGLGIYAIRLLKQDKVKLAWWSFTGSLAISTSILVAYFTQSLPPFFYEDAEFWQWTVYPSFGAYPLALIFIFMHRQRPKPTVPLPPSSSIGSTKKDHAAPLYHQQNDGPSPVSALLRAESMRRTGTPPQAGNAHAQEPALAHNPSSTPTTDASMSDQRTQTDSELPRPVAAPIASVPKVEPVPTPSKAKPRPSQPLLIATAAVALLALGAWWFFDLRHRHTLTAEERAQVEGWYNEIKGETDWVVIDQKDVEATELGSGYAELGFEMETPTVTTDAYGNLTVEVAFVLPPLIGDFGPGRFKTTLQRRFDELSPPDRVPNMCNDDEQYRDCITWSIISSDSMTIEFGNKDNWPGVHSVIPARRFEALRKAAGRARSLVLAHAIDSIAQGTGMVRRGVFRSYTCGDECGATFLEFRNSQPMPITYVCNTNRFGDVQLSTGDMIGAGDFTNTAIVGHEFLIVSKQVALQGSGAVWAVMGLLPFQGDELAPELQQRLAVSTNFDAGSPLSSTSGTPGSLPAFGSAAHVHDTKDVEVPPSYPGGEEALFGFLKRSVHYPEAEQDAGIQGVVYAEFVVASDGSIRDARTMRGVSEGLDREALRVIRSMPRWTPGRINNSPVDVRYRLPVRFTLK